MTATIRSLAVGTLVAVVLALTGCASGGRMADQAGAAPAAGETARFPDAGSAWLQGGTFVDVAQLRRIGRGMTKNQVRELIGAPHFGEGLFGPTVWNYLFNFRTGSGDEFVSCQYQVVFKDSVSDALAWRDPACADRLRPVVSEVLRPVGAAAAPQHFRLSADALFAFDKSGTADMLPDGRRQLDELVMRIRHAYRRLDSVSVVGHTDRLGNDAYNQALSIARAATVRDYLAAQGLPQAVLRAYGVGRMQPLTTRCADSLPRSELIDCLQPDRRVELDVGGER